MGDFGFGGMRGDDGDPGPPGEPADWVGIACVMIEHWDSIGLKALLNLYFVKQPNFKRLNLNDMFYTSVTPRLEISRWP